MRYTFKVQLVFEMEEPPNTYRVTILEDGLAPVATYDVDAINEDDAKAKAAERYSRGPS